MHLLLLSDTLSTAGRTFSGIANSGKPFTYQGKRAIVDMASLTLSDKVPALLLHDRNQRVGFGRLSIKDNALMIEGQLLDNDHAKSIIKDADTGFPWQMSAHVNSDDSYELAEGQSVSVNGHTIQYPCTILKNAVIREVSFTPTGVDNHTSAVILSDEVANSNDLPSTQADSQNDKPPLSDKRPSNQDLNHLTPKNNTPSKQTPNNPPLIQQEQAMSDINTNPPTTANLNARIEAFQEENQTLKQTIDELKKELATAKRQHKQSAISAKLSAKGYKPSDTGFVGLSNSTVDLLLSADDDKLDDIIGDLPSPKADNASFLLSEQYSTDTKTESNPLLADAKARQ